MELAKNHRAELNRFKQLIVRERTRKGVLNKDKTRFADAFRREVGMYVTTHLNKHTNAQIAKELDISAVTLAQWKTFSVARPNRVAFKFGANQIRLDVRTKAILVQEIVETGRTTKEVAEEVGVSMVTVQAWVREYKTTYATYLEAPDGIPWIAKEKNIIRGIVEITREREEIVKRFKSLKTEIKVLEDKKVSLDKEELTILQARVKELELA